MPGEPSLRLLGIPEPDVEVGLPEDILDKLNAATHPRTPITDKQLIAIAQRYIELRVYGTRYPLPVIAEEFGISQNQASDRVRKAREQRADDDIDPPCSLA